MAETSRELSRKQQFEALQSRQINRLKHKKSTDNSGDIVKPPRSIVVANADDDLGLQTLASHRGAPMESVGKQIGLPQEQLESLQERIKAAEKEKTNLEDKVHRQASELKKLHRQREDELKALGDAGSSSALAKLVELSKRNREMTAELEAEKSRVKQLNNQIKTLEVQVATLMSQITNQSGNEQVKPTVLATGSDLKTVEDLTSHCKKLEERLGRVTSKLTEMRNQCQQYKRDLKTTQMVLAKEVGEGVSVSDLLSTPSGWRGRSQQILSLQKKVQQLQQQLAHHSRQGVSGDSILSKTGQLSRTTLTDSEVGLSQVEVKHRSMLKQMESEKKLTQQQLVLDLESLQAEHTALKQKFNATIARNKIITTALKDSQQQVTVLLEKEKHDSELIAALMAQQPGSSDAKHVAQLGKLCDHKDSQITQLKSQIDKLQRLTVGGVMAKSPTSGSDSSVLQCRAVEARSAPSIGRQLIDRQTSSTKRPSTGHEMVTRIHQRPSSLLELNCQLQEQWTLCRVAEVERDRLLQLVSTLQRELGDVKQAASDALVNLHSERRTTALLETKLGQRSVDILFNDQSPPHLDDLQQRLYRQEEECRALRRTIAELRREKEEDMRLYDDLHKQTKQIFLEGVRRLKTDAKMN